MAEKQKQQNDKNSFMDQVGNLDVDTKNLVHELIEKMDTSNNSDIDMNQFYYLVQAEGIPVNYRHPTLQKTALMCAAERGSLDSVQRLLKLRANPLLTIHLDGRALNSYDLAMSHNRKEVAEMMKEFMQLSIDLAYPEDDEYGSTTYDRLLLDIYYDTLIQPGINRGVFMEDIVDLNLIVKLVLNIHDNKPSNGAILIFLPGYDEIVQLASLLYNALDSNPYELFILHSNMQTADQRNVFDPIAEGIRKIILSTNIAESSITVPDVVSFLLSFYI
jgi:hypothetical protein